MDVNVDLLSDDETVSLGGGEKEDSASQQPKDSVPASVEDKFVASADDVELAQAFITAALGALASVGVSQVMGTLSR